MLNKPLVGKKGTRRGRNKSERCVRAQPSSINSDLPRRRYVLPVVVLIGQQQRSLTLARGSLATCHINDPMVDQNLSSSNFLV